MFWYFVNGSPLGTNAYASPARPSLTVTSLSLCPQLIPASLDHFTYAPTSSLTSFHTLSCQSMPFGTVSRQGYHWHFAWGSSYGDCPAHGRTLSTSGALIPLGLLSAHSGLLLYKLRSHLHTSVWLKVPPSTAYDFIRSVNFSLSICNMVWE